MPVLRYRLPPLFSALLTLPSALMVAALCVLAALAAVTQATLRNAYRDDVRAILMNSERSAQRATPGGAGARGHRPGRPDDAARQGAARNAQPDEPGLTFRGLTDAFARNFPRRGDIRVGVVLAGR